ncbi:hypothetical protein PUNSTDRAFT_133664 [Punctularia strigosozonata HHB-11173 SS5]|uniref:uncharacterized protein n=1 Tax=Punctularia strigosozonata (strain HHB-11173) TaxID=741275 RepID=UPI00044168CA|nr:uncharacterized protein PUNSTDRAFT_133664 [Punctularia strigosozonata HHB-11173 SS5]EIN09892.1 hypothetical protein PUNSTDRAFT_133664 [Punctularia strigosozonata HHB-11173 SS5]
MSSPLEDLTNDGGGDRSPRRRANTATDTPKRDRDNRPGAFYASHSSRAPIQNSQPALHPGGHLPAAENGFGFLPFAPEYNPYVLPMPAMGSLGVAPSDMDRPVASGYDLDMHPAMVEGLSNAGVPSTGNSAGDGPRDCSPSVHEPEESPAPNRPKRKHGTKFSKAELYELARTAVDIDPGSEPWGKITQAWQRVAEHLWEKRMFVGSSVETIKNKMNSMVSYHEGSSLRVSRDIQEVLDGPEGASFGSILDTAVTQRDAVRDKSDKQKSRMRKKKADDEKGGARVRAAAMQTMKSRHTHSRISDDEDSDNQSDLEPGPSKRRRAGRQSQDDEYALTMQERMADHYECLEAHYSRIEARQDTLAGELRRMVDVYEHGTSTIVAAIEGLGVRQPAVPERNAEAEAVDTPSTGTDDAPPPFCDDEEEI